MSEIVGVEVDGEIDGREDDDGRRFPGRFGLPAVVALVGIVVMVGAVSVLSDLNLGRGGAPSVGPRGGAVIDGGQPADRREPDPRIERAKGALSAWGEFAASGDVTRLDGWFDPSGPQYRMLKGEASGLEQGAARQAYTVTATDERLVAEQPNEAVVEATVTWTRSGEQDQHYRWEIVLRGGRDKHWRLWTVSAPQAKAP